MAGRKIDIDEKIERAQEDVIKAKKKYDETVEALEKLMTKKKEMQQKELLQAFANSSKSKLGKIVSADQGHFSIEHRDQNTPYIKKVRVVSTVTYALKD